MKLFVLMLEISEKYFEPTLDVYGRLGLTASAVSLLIIQHLKQKLTPRYLNILQIIPLNSRLA